MWPFSLCGRGRCIRTALVLASVYAVSLAASAQAPPGAWVQVTTLPDDLGRYDDLWFVDAQTGWTVNSVGQLFATEDGGATWAMRYDGDAGTGENIYFRSVAFADAQRGWLGTLGTPKFALMETTDGGETVTSIVGRISGPAPDGICGIWIVDAQTVVGVGTFFGTPRIVRTTDGGATWVSQDVSDIASALIDVYFLDAERGFAVGQAPELDGARGVILSTEDGGATWAQRFVSSAAEQGWKISFPTPEVGYVTAQNFNPAGARVFKTTDAGLTWTEIDIPLESTFLSAAGFASEEEGWIGGQPALTTTDGGATWEPFDYVFDSGEVDMGPVNRIRFYEDGRGFAGGNAFYRYVSGGVSVEDNTQPVATRLSQNYPNPFNIQTVIPFTLDAPADVRLEVYDTLGRRVAVLEEGERTAGLHRVVWDGTNDRGRDVGSGVYVYRLVVGTEGISREAVVIR